MAKRHLSARTTARHAVDEAKGTRRGRIRWCSDQIRCLRRWIRCPVAGSGQTWAAWVRAAARARAARTGAGAGGVAWHRCGGQAARMLALGAEEDNDDSCTTRAARCREAGAPASQTAVTGGAAGVGRRRRGQWQPLRWPEGVAATPVVAATVAEAEASELVAVVASAAGRRQ